jgi:hypothetical protein
LFAYFVLARKQSKGKPGRKYQGKVIKLKGFSTFIEYKSKLKLLQLSFGRFELD